RSARPSSLSLHDALPISLAVADERARIAREMHDVVAHSLSVIIAQADGGRFVASQKPEKAVEVLGTISETGRAALADMRSLLGVLRQEDETSVGPQPGPEMLPDLVERVRSAGAPPPGPGPVRVPAGRGTAGERARAPPAGSYRSRVLLPRRRRARHRGAR